MMKSGIIQIAFFMLFVNYALSQQLIQGVVENSVTHEFLPFTNIQTVDRLLAISNEKGHFSLQSENNTKKEVRFSFLGYNDLIINIDSLNKSELNFVYLTPLTTPLKEVIIKESEYSTRMAGCRKNKSNGEFCTMPGNQIARFIPNKDSLSGYIKTAGFYISKKGNPSTVFRIKIYSANSLLKPDSQILSSNITVSNPGNGNNWMEISLAEFGLKIPKYGFFVSMEWLPASDNKNFGQLLGSSNEFEENLTWQIYWNGDCVKKLNSKNATTTLNAMIRAELLIEKK